MKKRKIEKYKVDAKGEISCDCPYCGEKHYLEYRETQRNDDAWGCVNDDINCDCGAMFNIDMDVAVNVVFTKATPPPSHPDNQLFDPAPNQIDMFTNKTISGKSIKTNQS